jgi:ABC-2 type transport system ATP-binding protein
VNVITSRDLSKRYGRRVGIDGINLDIPEGAIFGFLGPNGAGKTTTIRVLLGFLRPSDGRASVFGMDSWRDSPRIKREVGYLPGDLRLYPWLTATTALRIVGRIRGLDLTDSGADLAERFRLELRLPVREMSRGMRQKLGLILAMAHRPRLLVLDEPTSGLDPLMRQELAARLRELASSGRTVFFSSHTLSEVEQLCDRVAIVRQGRIVADEALESLRRRAPRDVTLVFEDAEAARSIQPPDFLVLGERAEDAWRCELKGSAPELVRWAAVQPIRDLTIGPPDLESLFHKFYQSPEEPS